VLQSCENNLLACLLNLACEKDFVQDRVDLYNAHINTIQINAARPHAGPVSGHTHLVEIEDQIQLAHVSEELVQDFNEEMDRFQVCELIVICVDADAEE
jgi:hypothetical protein